MTTKIHIATHMKKAFEAAIKDFAMQGFLYRVKELGKIDDWSIEYEIDASEQQILSLGIKTGFKLASEPQEK